MLSEEINNNTNLAELVKLIKCPLCSEIYLNPRILPCGNVMNDKPFAYF